MGDWKIVRVNNEDSWELYNMAEDPSESNDLSLEKPDIVEELLKAYKDTDFFNK
jgi:arylsulfatase